MVAADGAWTFQLQNTAVEGRYSIGALLGQANVQSSAITPMVTWRSGVIPSSSYAGLVFDLLVAQTASPSLSVMVYTGACVINRPGQGPYLCWNSTIKTVTVDAGDATNPRRDLIVARVYDSAIGDASTTFAIEVVTGTPAASPSDPAVPAGAIPLARISVGVNASSVSSANIASLRKSTTAPGAVRSLLEGDSTATTTDGYLQGEMRFRKGAGSIPDMVEYWGSDGTWHSLTPQDVVCRVNFSGSVTIGTPDTFAQGGWSAVEDPYGMFHGAPGAGTYSYVQIPSDGRYLFSYHTSMNPGTGSVAATISKGSPIVNNSVARDSKPAVTTGGDGTWCHAWRELPLVAGDKLYWANWSSTSSTMTGTVLNIPQEMYVRKVR
jgi:hypothetical protein